MEHTELVRIRCRTVICQKVFIIIKIQVCNANEVYDFGMAARGGPQTHSPEKQAKLVKTTFKVSEIVLRE